MAGVVVEISFRPYSVSTLCINSYLPQQYVEFYCLFFSQFYKQGKKHTDVRLLGELIIRTWEKHEKDNEGLAEQIHINRYFHNTWVI